MGANKHCLRKDAALIHSLSLSPSLFSPLFSDDVRALSSKQMQIDFPGRPPRAEEATSSSISFSRGSALKVGGGGGVCGDGGKSDVLRCVGNIG